MAFADVSDVEARLGRDLTTEEAAQVEVLLEDATDIIRAAAGGQVIYPAGSETVTLSAYGRRVLRLPQNPVTAVASVTTNGVLDATSSYTWTRDGALSRVSGSWWYNDVAVVYSYGYASVPADLKRLCSRLAVDLFDGESDTRSEGIGSYNVVYLRSSSGDRSPLRADDMRIVEKYMPVYAP